MSSLLASVFEKSCDKTHRQTNKHTRLNAGAGRLKSRRKKTIDCNDFVFQSNAAFTAARVELFARRRKRAVEHNESDWHVVKLSTLIM